MLALELEQNEKWIKDRVCCWTACTYIVSAPRRIILSESSMLSQNIFFIEFSGACWNRLKTTRLLKFDSAPADRKYMGDRTPWCCFPKCFRQNVARATTDLKYVDRRPASNSSLPSHVCFPRIERISRSLIPCTVWPSDWRLCASLLEVGDDNRAFFIPLVSSRVLIARLRK